MLQTILGEDAVVVYWITGFILAYATAEIWTFLEKRRVDKLIEKAKKALKNDE